MSSAHDQHSVLTARIWLLRLVRRHWAQPPALTPGTAPGAEMRLLPERSLAGFEKDYAQVQYADYLDEATSSDHSAS